VTRYATPQEQTAGRIQKMIRDNPNLQAYVEIVSEHVMWRIDLTDYDLRSIRDFTRGNIASWLCKDSFEAGLYGCQDFHAVCGDIDLPWATEKSRLIWEGARTKKGEK